MSPTKKIDMKSITIEIVIARNLADVWSSWTDPDQIKAWNHASDDWHCPYASNDLRVDGTFSYTMASKDGKTQFDFTGRYTEIQLYKNIRYEMSDGRKVYINFESLGTDSTKVTETFDAESVHSVEAQRSGWATILANFKKHTESSIRI
jgi:uncharacterized protein YndB with AHSA1/START domain